MSADNITNLDGCVAVVTGSSSGIGRAIALELASAGADVLVHARQSRKAATEVADQVRDRGQKAIVVLSDLADPQSHEQLVEQACQWQGQVHIWVNNAGADVLTGDAASWSFEQKLASLWSVDVNATIRLSRMVGQRMTARVVKQKSSPAPIHPTSESGMLPIGPLAAGMRGVILNMGWDRAASGMAGDSGEMFAATKGAIMSFSRSLARSLAPHVRVNCLAPGWIKTAWAENASEYWDRRAVGESLAGRWGQPEDVARVARFLASPQADFVSGQVINVNGGLASLDDGSQGSQ